MENMEKSGVEEGLNKEELIGNFVEEETQHIQKVIDDLELLLDEKEKAEETEEIKKIKTAIEETQDLKKREEERIAGIVDLFKKYYTSEEIRERVDSNLEELRKIEELENLLGDNELPFETEKTKERVEKENKMLIAIQDKKI